MWARDERLLLSKDKMGRRQKERNRERQWAVMESLLKDMHVEFGGW